MYIYIYIYVCVIFTNICIFHHQLKPPTTFGQEERIHPYGRLDLGEVPFAMASFANKMIALKACLALSLF